LKTNTGIVSGDYKKLIFHQTEVRLDHTVCSRSLCSFFRFFLAILHSDYENSKGKEAGFFFTASGEAKIVNLILP
jgi:hypothetical protein